MKSKTTGALLAFFLGGLGIHRFYLGQPGLGLIYLLTSWTLVPAFIAVIDFIVLLAYSEQRFDSKYNKSKPFQTVPNKSEETNPSFEKLEETEKSLVNVSSNRTENSTEISIDFNKDKLIQRLKEKQVEREAEIKNYDYFPIQIQRQGLQLLESVHILNQTKSFDTLIGRFQFISEMYDSLMKASYNRRYITDVQVAIDEYKSMYYDKILEDFELELLVKPSKKKLTEYYSNCLFECFEGFHREQIAQIENLKRDDAKRRRKEKVIDIADKTILEFEKNGSENNRFKPMISSVKEILARYDASGDNQSLTSNLINPIVINPKSTFELTLYNAGKGELKKAIRILKDENIWNKEKELTPLFAAHNIKCKEIEDYINLYNPKYVAFIKEAKADSVEYKEASEMDKLDIVNEFKEQAIDTIYERANVDLSVLFDGSDIPENSDEGLVVEYGFDVISKYNRLLSKNGKIITNWERKDFQDLIESDLAISGSEIPENEILLSQTLKTLNKIAEKEEGHFKRKQKAINYLIENPQLLANIGKYVSTRSIFKIKTLPPKYANVNLEELSNSWDYIREYLSLLVDTYTNAERCTEISNGDKSWIKGFVVEKHEDFNNSFICERARKECLKKHSKNRPPKVPFHVGCNCHLESIF